MPKPAPSRGGSHVEIATGREGQGREAPPGGRGKTWRDVERFLSSSAGGRGRQGYSGISELSGSCAVLAKKCAGTLQMRVLGVGARS